MTTFCFVAGVAAGAAGVAPAWWCRCAARPLPTLPQCSPTAAAGTPAAFPSRLPRFPSWGKQDTSRGGGEQSVPPAHPDTEGTNTNMPVRTGGGKHPWVHTCSSAQPGEKHGRSSMQHLCYGLNSASIPFPCLFLLPVLNNWLPYLSGWHFEGHQP